MYPTLQLYCGHTPFYQEDLAGVLGRDVVITHLERMLIRAIQLLISFN